jgi:predicted O-methyltransferase YrrM
MINIPFTKETRLDLIKLAIKTTNAKSYLEIGCDKNQIFSQLSVEHMVGVDPAKGGNVRMTSDEFFAQNNEMFDVIFIDGLHYYEQVGRDLDNALKVLTPGGIIILHDMLPISEQEAVVPIPATKQVWLGDVWRLAFDLSKRTDVNFNLLLIDHGCGVVTKGPQTGIEIEIENSWGFYEQNWTKLPVISFDKFSHMLPTLTRL